MYSDIWCIFGISISLSISLYLIILIILPEELNYNQTPSTKLSDRRMEETLNIILENSLATQQDKLKLDKRIATLNNSSLPLRVRFINNFLDILHDPYAKVTAFSLFIGIAGTLTVSIIVAILLTNIAVGISCCIVSFILPIVFFKSRSFSMEYSNICQNAHLLELHYMNIVTAKTIAESFDKTLKALDSGTRNYYCVLEFYKSRTERKRSIPDALDDFINTLNPDICVKQYVTSLKKIATEGERFKPTLKLPMKQLQGIADKNRLYVKFITVGFNIYVVLYILCILTLFYYKYFQNDMYIKITNNLVGQIFILILFLCVGIFVLPILKGCKITNLNIFTNTDKDDEKEED